MDTEDLEIHSEYILDIVSANVKKYRQLKGFSQMKLALDIGMTGGAYFGRAELRKNNHHFNIRHIAKIAIILDINIEALFEI